MGMFLLGSHKGPNIAGLDPETGELTRLFHPRTDLWTDHFEWAGVFIGERPRWDGTTVVVLAVNDSDSVAVREALRDEDVFELLEP